MTGTRWCAWCSAGSPTGVDLGFEEIDDLQLAVERLLAEAGSRDSVKLAFEISENGRANPDRPAGRAARSPRRSGTAPASRPWRELTLRRILETVVDSFGVEHVADDDRSHRAAREAEAGGREGWPLTACIRRSRSPEDRELLRRYHEEGDAPRARS